MALCNMSCFVMYSWNQIVALRITARSAECGLITLGPTKDNTKVFGIYEADSEAAVRKLIELDPYWQNGIWTEYEVKEWIQAF